MLRSEMLEILKEVKINYANLYGVFDIGLFGSYARDKANQNSDIDVVVKLNKQDLFNIIGIKQYLEERLEKNVDIISYRDNMNPFLKNRIDKEAIYV
jgi:uncharacterized protein